MQVSTKVNFEELARSTDEMNGAQLKAVCVEAGMIALREGSKMIGHEHYLSGVLEVQSKKKNDQVSPSSRCALCRTDQVDRSFTLLNLFRCNIPSLCTVTLLNRHPRCCRERSRFEIRFARCSLAISTKTQSQSLRDDVRLVTTLDSLCGDRSCGDEQKRSNR